MMICFRTVSLLMAALLGLLVSGCARDRPLETACPALDRFTYPQLDTSASPQPDARPLMANSLARAPSGRTSISDAFARAYQTTGEGPDSQPLRTHALTATVHAEAPPRWSDALILSGGGQWGAYGAGLISRWASHGRLPARIVTGISTGALQSTFAYLGDDAGLVDAYSITNERQLVRRHGSAFFLDHGSTADIAPLKTYLIQHIGPLIPRVAAETTTTKRRLFVGAVDGLSGTFHMIDLTQIATDGDLSAMQRQDCYIAALMASAAVPVIFRQVTINNRPWLDGGVRHALFLPEIVRQIDMVHQMDTPQTVRTDGRVYAIKNGVTQIDRLTDLPAALLPTLGRLRTIVFDQNDEDSLALAAFHARQGGLSLYVSSADGWNSSGLSACTGAKSGREDMIFDPKFMACLIAYGQSRWQSGDDPWSQKTVE
jgi:hypothetical protein